MMTNRVYRIVCFEVAADDGVTATEIPTATFITEATNPWCAMIHVGEQLAAEDAS